MKYMYVGLEPCRNHLTVVLCDMGNSMQYHPTPLWMSSAHLHSIASSCISVPICLCMLNCTLEEQLPWKGISVITPKN